MDSNKIIIDGSRINSEAELHAFLKEKLNFPEYYGMNLNALWDMLTAWVEYPLMVEWRDFSESKKKFGTENAVNFLKVFQDYSEAFNEINLIVSE